MTVLRRTLDRLAGAAARMDRVLLVDAAVASLLAAPFAALAGTGAARIDRALDQALGRGEAPPATASAVRPRPTVASGTVTPARPVSSAPRNAASARLGRRSGQFSPETPVTTPRPGIVVVTGRTRVAPPAVVAAEAAGLAGLAARIPGGVVAARSRLPSPGDTATAHARGGGPGAAGRAPVASPAPLLTAAAPTSAAARAVAPPAPALTAAVPAAAASGAVSSPTMASIPAPRAAAGVDAVAPTPEPTRSGIVLRAAPRPDGGPGLARLAAWWRDHEAAAAALPDPRATTPAPRPSSQDAYVAPSPELAADPLAGELDAMDAFSRALERVLLGEARRHGVPLEEP